MNFDILIIGAGPAGLHAARVAAQTGCRVGIVDDNVLPGGQIWRQGPEHAPDRQVRTVIDALTQQPNVTWMSGTRVAQALPGRQLLAENRRSGVVIGYDKLIVATGARERFLPFPGWTLPGVTGAGGLQALIKGGTPVRGQRIVVAGSGPLLWASAATARAAGARIAAIVEQASPRSVRGFAAGLVSTPAKLAQALRLRLDLHDTPYLCGAHVVEASGEGEEGGLARVRIHQRERRGETTIDCERLACAYGLVPNTSIGVALGCALREVHDTVALEVDDWQATSVPDIYAAGESTGVGGMELSAVEGRIAAYAALGARENARALFNERARYRRFADRLHTAFALAPHLRNMAAPDTILCRCEDVTFGEAAQHRSWRDAKLHTRCGMGPCQGKICGEAAAFCFGWPRSGQRPPFVPVRVGTLMEAAPQS